MVSGSCNEAPIPHRKGLLHGNYRQRMEIPAREGAGNKHHKGTPEATTVPLSRSTSSTTKIRKPSLADWSKHRIPCMQGKQEQKQNKMKPADTGTLESCIVQKSRTR
ncbi:Hypothetical predicted protein [Pelobates cultripes]|uniref:Uncharacterized protein n=1 Tax=Pelobates cultripes TaxID=61616 RepID=A0AAD1WLH4_PELCU|nr:Hypothetical predicted protein [Pelobates cultripes]